MERKDQQGCPCHHLGRRDFLKLGAAAAAGLLLPQGAQAANNIREMQGTVFVNRNLANSSTPIQPGDIVTVAEGGKLSFVVDQDAYVLRGGTSLQLETSNNVIVKGLRLLTGGILAVFGKGEKTIHAQSISLGIRGTGIYLDTTSEKTFFCTCYGETEIQVEGINESTILKATHHESAWVHTPPSGENRIEQKGAWMGNFVYHNDDELRAAEALVGRRVPFDT